MKLIINGEPKDFAAHVSVAAVLESLGISADHRGIAVAVNERIVPRSGWAEQELAEQDRVEIVHAVQGG